MSLHIFSSVVYSTLYWYCKGNLLHDHAWYWKGWLVHSLVIIVFVSPVKRWNHNACALSFCLILIFSPLHPNISIDILYTLPYTCPLVLTGRICLTIKTSQVGDYFLYSHILINIIAVLLWGENRCWSISGFNTSSNLRRN